MKTTTKLAIVAGIFMGVVLGAIFSGLALNIAGESLIIKEMKSPYDDVDKTVGVIKTRIDNEPGWHVITIYDYDKEVRDAGGESIGAMKLIKFCSAEHASQMLSMDRYKKLGAMLPKTLAVYEKSDGHVYVAAGNGAVIGKMFHGKAAGIIEATSYEIENIMRFMNFKFTLF